jgi:hypothetical protein
MIETLRAPAPVVIPAARRLRLFHGWGMPELFVISQTLLPALLYAPGTQAIRLPIRIAAFATSLLALGWWLLHRTRHMPAHPAQRWLIAAMLYLAAMVVHPLTNNLTAGIAHVMLYLAVCAPVFWAPALVRDRVQVERLLWLLLLCNGLNSVVGVLQVYDPAQWMPDEFSRQVVNSRYGLQTLTYIGPNGERIVRPPGLFDSPGAVAGPAMLATLLGVVFCVGRYPLWRKAIGAALAFAGVAAIYLSLVRTSLLIVAGMVIVYVVALMRQRRGAGALGGLALGAVIVTGALSFSVDIGGSAVSGRVATLFEADPITVYYSTARGEALEAAFSVLASEYPLGAGLGRWGMIHQYFRDASNFESYGLFAELQPNAWIIDGGLVLLGLYSVALCVSALREYQIVKSRVAAASIAAAVFAANAGTIALAFGFTPFTTQVGLQYWFLVGILHGLHHQRPEPARR